MIISATSVGNNTANLNFSCDIEAKTAKFYVRAYIDGFHTTKEYVEFTDAVDEYKRLAAMVEETRKGANGNA